MIYRQLHPKLTETLASALVPKVAGAVADIARLAGPKTDAEVLDMTTALTLMMLVQLAASRNDTIEGYLQRMENIHTVLRGLTDDALAAAGIVRH